MIEYCVLLIPFAQIIVAAHDNETVEKAFRRQYPYCSFQLHKVIAKRDMKGNGIWEIMK